MYPGDAIVIGDSPYDAEAAGKAGMRTIAVLCGGFQEQDLRQAGAGEIYRDPADLLATFEQSPLGRERPPRRKRRATGPLLLTLGLVAGAALALAVRRRRA